ncbi:MAG: glycosyltransferase family 2 protein [Pseudomonadota bacterium]
MNNPEKVADMVSVVIPVYMSENIIYELYERLVAVLTGLNRAFELIMVDDSSTDNSYRTMQAIHSKDPCVKIIRLSCNHGQQYATLCGLRYARGGYIITMDDDLQNPPEEIPNFIKKIDEGFDVVIGKIIEKKHPFFRRAASKLAQKLMCSILGKPQNLILSSYRGFSRRAVDKITKYEGVFPFLPALIFATVHNSAIVNIDVAHADRYHGGSTYSFFSLLKVTSFLLINHSAIFLRLIALWGLLLSVGSLFLAFYLFIYLGMVIKGWIPLAILISFFSGNIILSIGILGEYSSRILKSTTTTKGFGVFEEEL